MATKRTHSAMDVVHPSRQAQVPGSTRPSKKLRRMEPPILKKQAHASSVNAIKKRIRDVKRRLERSQNLPATIRVEDERALAAYEQELAAADEEKTRQKMIKKYHMVRFFERQKATRQLKKLRKQILEAQTEEEVTIIKTKMHVAEVDLNYTQYFPLYQRYISLYPPKDSRGADRSNHDEHSTDTSKKPSMWAEVERRMVDGTLSLLRNGSSATAVSQGMSRSSKPAKIKSKSRPTQAKPNGTKPRKDSARHPEKQIADEGKRKVPTKATVASEEDDESDGGFFEE